jgi:Glu-tRNA(Gln) amidotransferase subunit E-like FAD-binding protein
MIERDVCYIANLIDLNRLPESKSTFAHVRGAVAYTDNALRTRSMQRDQLYQEVSAIQRSHIEDPRVDSFERAAKQSLKRMLIAKLCQNITETSKRHAEEIARLDAEQADFVYQEAFEDAIGLVDTSDYRNRALSEENYVSFKASDPSTRSPAALSILPNE